MYMCVYLELNRYRYFPIFCPNFSFLFFLTQTQKIQFKKNIYLKGRKNASGGKVFAV